MNIGDIDWTTRDNDVIYYRHDQVIAIGTGARQFVKDRLDGADPTHSHEPTQTIDWDGLPPTITPPPPSFVFEGVDDPLALVNAARAQGLRVQLNHVLFAHGGCCCDPCCATNPYGAFPLKATPLKATPLKATPLKATPTGTTAKPRSGGEKDDQERERGDAVVWILDTGVSDGRTTPLQPDIESIPSERTDQPDEDGNDEVDPVAGHGTFIAGIVDRLAPASTIHVFDVMDRDGHVDEAEVAAKIMALLLQAEDWGHDLTKTVMNLSFGGGLHTDCNWCLRDAIAAAQEAGVVVVASAGNDGACEPVYPANFAGVIAVGALDAEGDPARFTNRGSWVNACALGEDIVSEFFDLRDEDGNDGPIQPPFRGWARWSGTSFAAPVVAGLTARAIGPGASAVEASTALLEQGAPLPCLGVRVHGPDEPAPLLHLMDTNDQGGGGSS